MNVILVWAATYFLIMAVVRQNYVTNEQSFFNCFDVPEINWNILVPYHNVFSIWYLH